jgi:putative ABC transport system permease protein
MGIGKYDMQTLWQDIRYGFRSLRGSFVFTGVAVITLTLGIGANAAIFSVVNAVLLRPLPYRDAERIVAIQEVGKDGKRMQVTPANFLDWRAQSASFEHLAAILERTSNIAGESQAERINLAMTSANFFDVFGVQPSSGRFFLDEDEKAGHPAIAVISHGLWQRRFGAAADVVGKAITLDGRNYAIVGVAPSGFDYPNKTELWVPPFNLAPALSESMDVTRVRGFGFLSAVALLKPGVPIEKAASEMETITARLRQQYPETNNNRFNRVVTLHTHLVGDTSTVLWLLLGAVGFVLLIACANVANLMLVRVTVRQKEIAIRTALGASRLRIVRQLLTESVMLALTGGVLGILLAWWGLELLAKLLPRDFPRLQGINLDTAVLGFTMAVSLITGIVFGIAPAWEFSRAGVHECLKDNSRGAIGGGARSRLRGLFVVAEVALSLVLLVGAGLLFRSFLRLQSVEAGFNPARVLTLRLNPSGTTFQNDEQFVAYYQKVLEGIRLIPGVETAGAINTLPLSKGPTLGFRVEGRPPLPPDQWSPANYRNVSPDYFRAMNIPIIRGRAVEERDNALVPPVVLINQAIAERDFADEDPVGKRINFGGADANNQPIWTEIVGVVANVRSLELNTDPMPEIYTSTMQDAFANMSIVVRTTIEPDGLASAVRQASQEVDKTQPVSDLRTMDRIVSESISQPRLNLTLLAIFGGLALILSAAGIYGVIAYSVSQRIREIGIRIALGAKAGDVLRMVIGQGMKLAAAGVALGLGAAWALTRLLETLLFGVSATDPLTFVVITVSLTGVALAACWVPARRAGRVDPMVALRQE